MEPVGTLIAVDGNEAAARVAHRLSEVIAIYPITPSSPMGELADAWSAAGRTNLWGAVPQVIEMQSEGGAAGALHGALQAGALCTTFTASQGLLLMIPNMYKIAGELTPAVIHVAARTLATHALSIFGDQSDVMAVRQTGWAMLASSDVQAAQDLAAIAHAATLECRVPFLHFFDGFRTSHEVNVIRSLPDEVLRELVDDHLVRAHRERALSPDHPVLRGTAQNPDVFFQAREASNPFHAIVPQVVQWTMDRFAELTGRAYHLFDYHGAPDAERIVVLMGSGSGAVEETVDALVAGGEKVGAVNVRLFRPFSAEAFAGALPPTVRAIAVLDRTKEPGAPGEPLYQDLVTSLSERVAAGALPVMPRVIGGRYGLSSKEFDPAMAKAVFDELAKGQPKNHFTVGIVDDVSHTSLEVDRSFTTEADDVVRAVFYGLGADGTVSANKSSVKIIGEGTDLYAQGYFVYDSKKSGSMTTSHLRFGPRPIRSTYLIGSGQANFVACHQFSFLERLDVLEVAAPGATFLLNSPFGPETVWERLPVETQRTILEKRLRFHVVDAQKVATAAGLGSRVNTILQTCFFALAGVLDQAEAVARIKAAIEKSYGKRGRSVVEQNFAAVDAALDGMHEVPVPVRRGRRPAPPAAGPRRGPRLRPARDRDDARRPGRPAPGLGAAGRRDLPDRHGEVGEALDRAGDPDLGPGHLHRLRQVRAGLSAHGDPHEGVRADRRRPRARDVPAQGVARPREPRQVDDDPGRAGRLHGVRRVRRRLPGQVQGGRQAQGDRHDAEGRAPGRRAGEPRLLPGHPAGRPARGEGRLDQGLADARAPVRGQRGLRGVRRDAVPEAPLADVRRPDPGRERHRLLLDLRRQPADDPVVTATPTAADPPGRTRCSRTTRSSGSGCGWRSTTRWRSPAPCSSVSPGRSAMSLLARSSTHRRTTRRSSPTSASASAS